MVAEKQAAVAQAWTAMFAEGVRFQQQLALSVYRRYANAARCSGQKRGLADREHRTRTVSSQGSGKREAAGAYEVALKRSKLADAIRLVPRPGSSAKAELG